MLRRTGVTLSLLKHSWVGIPCLAMAEPRRAPFSSAEGICNELQAWEAFCRHGAWVTNSCLAFWGNLTALLCDLLCLAPRLVLTHVSPARCTGCIWQKKLLIKNYSCHGRDVSALHFKTMVYGAVGIRNLEIPCSAVQHHAPSAVTGGEIWCIALMGPWQIQHLRWNRGEITCTLTLSCFSKGFSCPCCGIWLLLKVQKWEQEPSLAESLWFSAWKITQEKKNKNCS